MQKHIHKAEERGRSDIGWLQSRFSFSFADYYNPKRMHFGALRVLNDDIIAAGQGFGSHPHDNMEIITIVTEGVLEHKDSMGTKGTLKPGDVQVMSAGSGLVHSEYNHSKIASLKLFQMWITPKGRNIKPRYDQKHFPDAELENQLCTVVSGEKNNDHLYMHQDAKVSLGNFTKGFEANYKPAKGNGVFFLIISGSAKIADSVLQERDSLEVAQASAIAMKFIEDTRLLAIEVPL